MGRILGPLNGIYMQFIVEDTTVAATKIVFGGTYTYRKEAVFEFVEDSSTFTIDDLNMLTAKEQKTVTGSVAEMLLFAYIQDRCASTAIH